MLSEYELRSFVCPSGIEMYIFWLMVDNMTNQTVLQQTKLYRDMENATCLVFPNLT